MTSSIYTLLTVSGSTWVLYITRFPANPVDAYEPNFLASDTISIYTFLTLLTEGLAISPCTGFTIARIAVPCVLTGFPTSPINTVFFICTQVFTVPIYTALACITFSGIKARFFALSAVTGVSNGAWFTRPIHTQFTIRTTYTMSFLANLAIGRVAIAVFAAAGTAFAVHTIFS